MLPTHLLLGEAINIKLIKVKLGLNFSYLVTLATFQSSKLQMPVAQTLDRLRKSFSIVAEGLRHSTQDSAC